MKSPVAALVGVIAGFAIGGVCMYNWPEPLQGVPTVRAAFQPSEQRTPRFEAKPSEFQEILKREDDYAADIILAALVKLEAGDIDTAKRRLIGAIKLYHLTWHDNGGDSNVLGWIEKYAAQYPDLAAPITTTKTNR
jgi:hypothetical protein